MLASSVLVLAAATAIPPPPPIITASPIPRSEQRLLTWHPGGVRCESGIAPRVETLRRPLNSLSWGDSALAAATFTFAIDAEGRPHSIRREGAARAFLDQAGPALAASRFAAGAPQQGCSITYDPKRENLTEAARADLVSYSLLTRTPTLPRKALDRMREGDGCAATPGMQPLVRVYPDVAKISPTPGVRDWTLVRFDVDADGMPGNIRTETGTGNAALDAAAVTALAESRFTAGPARRDCTLPFRRAPATLAAPPLPDLPEPEGGPCARTGNWAVAPQLVYPQPYRVRAIEGWAVLDYDVASWGEIGNVRIVDAQPSEDFGFAAKRMLERARRPEGQGATGCRTRVRYAIARKGAVPQDDPDES